MENKIICIGREYGSGGREIGEKLARQLGIPCYDKLLIKKAALESGLSEEFLSRTEESPINSIQFLSGNPYADVAGIGTAFYSESQMAYNAERTVIEQLAKQGPCVIIGRCADYVLRHRNPLRLFFYADIADRMERCRKRNEEQKSLNHDVLRKIITQTDKNRSRYYEFLSGQKWGAKENYDLCINTSSADTEKIIQCVISLL